MQSKVPLYVLGVALLLSAGAAAQNPTVRFTAATKGSAVAPKEFLVQPGVSEISCSFACSITRSCFGFYWLLGACRLFNLPAFLNASDWISIGASEVFVLGTNKLKAVSCAQSSNYGSSYCDKAIDGNTNSNHNAGSCSHTSNSLNEWWEAKLTAASHVAFVTIYNREDCCAYRFNNFDILVDGSVCNQVRLSAPFVVASFTCKAVGSRIRIVSRSDLGEHLTICELELFGFETR